MDRNEPKIRKPRSQLVKPGIIVDKSDDRFWQAGLDHTCVTSRGPEKSTGHGPPNDKRVQIETIVFELKEYGTKQG